MAAQRVCFLNSGVCFDFNYCRRNNKWRPIKLIMLMAQMELPVQMQIVWIKQLRGRPRIVQQTPIFAM